MCIDGCGGHITAIAKRAKKEKKKRPCAQVAR